MDSALEIDVTLDLPEFRLQVQEEVPLGGITAVNGPSGSGKTTFLRVLAGLEPGTVGTVRFAGQSWQDDATHLPPSLRRVGVVFQDARLFPHLDVAGNLSYGARRRGVKEDHVARIAEALRITPLLNRGTGGLSGGEARRVAVARALASDPQLLLLDEPLSGLDAELRATTLRVIADAVRELNIPVIHITHSPTEVAALADRVLGFSMGRCTGWQTPPVVLNAKAVLVDGDVMVHLGEASFPASAGIRSGDQLTLAIAVEDTLLSQHSPGDSTAAFSVLADVVGYNGDVVLLDLSGQILRLPMSGFLSSAAREPGQKLWLTVQKFWARSADKAV